MFVLKTFIIWLNISINTPILELQRLQSRAYNITPRGSCQIIIQWSPWGIGIGDNYARVPKDNL